jgi:hypothetical protein
MPILPGTTPIYNPPLVKLTGSTLISKTDNASTLPNRITYPNGTYTSTAPIGATGTSGANLPTKQKNNPLAYQFPTKSNVPSAYQGINASNLNPLHVTTPLSYAPGTSLYNQQITQLTAPYQGSLAALTGANMVEPAQTGFPGSDPRQPIPINLPTGSTTPSDTSGGGRWGGWGGGGVGGSVSNNGGSLSQILNWRIATG